jgi:hypothetical protein
MVVGSKMVMSAKNPQSFRDGEVPRGGVYALQQQPLLRLLVGRTP